MNAEYIENEELEEYSPKPFQTIVKKGVFCAERCDFDGEIYLFMNEDSNDSDIANAMCHAIGEHATLIHPGLNFFQGYDVFKTKVMKVKYPFKSSKKKMEEWENKNI